jgi:dATP pyrophosphohydrolase
MAYKIPESVLVVIHTAALEVLLLERADKPGYWQSVTGSKDALDEALQSTAIREVEEETGIVVLPKPENATQEKSPTAMASVSLDNLCDWQLSNIFEIYPVWRHRYAPGTIHNTEHVFGLQVPREISITLAPREHLNFAWLPYREAADKCFSASNAEAILQLPAHGSNSRSGA